MDTFLRAGITTSALGFRGYNVTNLGRTRELLSFPSYHSILAEELHRYSEICGEFAGRTVDLFGRVRDGREPSLDEYVEAVAIIVAVEVAHLRILREIHDVDWTAARLSFGYSLGELPAVSCGGGFKTEDLIRVPLALAADCAAMATDSTLAVLFSRGPEISEQAVLTLCTRITARGEGTIGVSSILSPNTILIVGQGQTVERFREQMKHQLPDPVHLRVNDARWPPLHTPILRQRNISDRAGVLLEQLPAGAFPLKPDVFSLVTSKRNYAEHTARDILRQWIDRPQRLWDGVCEVLAFDVKTVLHLGPEPNLVPATFSRVAENVGAITRGRGAQSYGVRAVAQLVRRPWLASILPARAALLRAPLVRHIVVEDWLLANAP